MDFEIINGLDPDLNIHGSSGGTGGSVGCSGARGPKGRSGTSGFSGSSGVCSGASGFSGRSGVSGNSGYSSASGTFRKSLHSGVSGFSGVSGASGSSIGFSGFSATWLPTGSGTSGVVMGNSSHIMTPGTWCPTGSGNSGVAQLNGTVVTPHTPSPRFNGTSGFSGITRLGYWVSPKPGHMTWGPTGSGSSGVMYSSGTITPYYYAQLRHTFLLEYGKIFAGQNRSRYDPQPLAYYARTETLERILLDPEADERLSPPLSSKPPYLMEYFLRMDFEYIYLVPFYVDDSMPYGKVRLGKIP